MPDYAIGVDLGGTKIAAVLIDRAGQIIEQMRHPTAPDEGIARIVERIAGYIRELEAATPHAVRLCRFCQVNIRSSA